LINTKIFQTIQIPEHIKPMYKIQKYLTKLGSSVKLLDQNKSNNKTNQRNSFHQSSSVILKNIKGEKERLIHDYQTIRSNPYEKKNEPKSTNRRYFKSRYLTDKLSFLKEKNKILKAMIIMGKHLMKINPILMKMKYLLHILIFLKLKKILKYREH
jgi:hypothetical protein